MQEYKINYNLQKIVKRNEVYNYILISVSWNNLRVRTTLKITIEENLWDKKKQRAKASSKNPREINDKLDKIRLLMNAYFEDVQKEFNRVPNLKETKEALQAVINDKPIKHKKLTEAKKNNNFIKTFEIFINDTEQGKRHSSNGKKIQAQSINVYSSALSHIKQYISKTKANLTLDDINENFYTSFLNYLSEKGLSNNYQSRIIKTINVMMNYTFEIGLHKNTQFKKSIKVLDVSSVKIALNIEELNRIEELENLSPKLEKVRQMFMIQSLSGLRFSDLLNLDKANIDYKNKTITLYVIKTQEPLKIPITSKLESYLKKYVGTSPISAQKYNDYLKELCQLANIDEQIKLTYYIGSKRVNDVKEKYKLVSSHTGRRNFITNSLLKGVIDDIVMKISGHKDKTSFQKYVLIAQEKAVETMRNAWEE